jgi:hypothetical protein
LVCHTHSYHLLRLCCDTVTDAFFFYDCSKTDPVDLETEGRIEVTAGKILPVPILSPGLGIAERSTLLKGPVVGEERL